MVVVHHVKVKSAEVSYSPAIWEPQEILPTFKYNNCLYFVDLLAEIPVLSYGDIYIKPHSL